ncbi:MAG: zinc-ribbon domain-containing protein [Phycisphaerae bacterium]|nr:zinc-ribbon domain-containing protein [Phycisphaerae bacterium]
MNGFFGMHAFGEGFRAHQQAVERQMDAVDASIQKTQISSDVRFLEDRLDKLLLVCSALWELLRDRTDLTEDDLLAKVQEVDLRDGQADGKITRTVKKCPKCGRTMSPRHKQCLYCGEPDLSAGAFDAAT